MFLALQHCNLHWNILGYGSGCKVVSFPSKYCVWAPVGMVNIFPAHTRFFSFPLFPHSVSLMCLCFSDENLNCSAFESSRGCIGRSELMYGLFLVRVKKGKKDWSVESEISLWRFQAANIPLVSELGIDDIHFDDFSLDVDAMITAALRMFMELGMVQKFKIDYEVTICAANICCFCLGTALSICTHLVALLQVVLFISDAV